MGKVYGPDDVIHRKGKLPDLTPHPMPQRLTPNRLEEMSKEIETIKAEIVKIMFALKNHGITVE